MWREWRIGDVIDWTVNDFDGCVSYIGEVSEIHDDHLIVIADDMTLWVDDDTEKDFKNMSKNMFTFLGKYVNI